MNLQLADKISPKLDSNSSLLLEHGHKSESYKNLTFDTQERVDARVGFIIQKGLVKMS